MPVASAGLVSRTNRARIYPPYSIVEASGWQMPDPSGSDISVTSPIVLGEQPGDPINPYACYITGAATVPAGGNGVCARPTLSTPLLVAIAGGETDANDSPYRLVGPVQGSWQVARLSRIHDALAAATGLRARSRRRPRADAALHDSCRSGRNRLSPVVVVANGLLRPTPAGAMFPQSVGQSNIQPIVNQSSSYAYLFCDQTYLFQGTIVAALNGIVVGIITGSRYEIGIAGTLTAPLAAQGQSTASVTYQDCFGNNINDTLTVYENIGLPSGQSIPSGTGVFIEWDNSLFGFVVVAAACGRTRAVKTSRFLAARAIRQFRPDTFRTTAKMASHFYNPWRHVACVRCAQMRRRNGR